MPRHPKCRRVCKMPFCCQFASSFSAAPGNKHKDILMTVEEYETIRLIDYMGLTQEECAQQMRVARTTVQRIYNNARKNLAVFLVEGTKLQISGGSYQLCGNDSCCDNLKPCMLHTYNNKERKG